MKLPILVKISLAIVEVYHFQKRAFLLTFHRVDFDVGIDASVALAKQKQNGV